MASVQSSEHLTHDLPRESFIFPMGFASPGILSTPSMKKSLRILCIAIMVVGALNLVAFFVHSQQLGGDALNGRQTNGQFYVSDHGRETQVSERAWRLNRWHALSLIVTHALLMGALATLLLKHEFPKKLFRGSPQDREQTARAIRASGPPTIEFGCAGKIGGLNFSNGLIKVAAYPGGLDFNLRFIGEFGVATSEIARVEKNASLLNSGIEITHHSPNIVSPILLRCANNETATRALLALNNRV